MNFPRTLIVSRLTWEDDSTSNTLSNLFQDYDSKQIARIYIETKQPRTKCCNLFFQISEIALLKRIFNRRIKTGRRIEIPADPNPEIPIDPCISSAARQEAGIMRFVRSHRWKIFTLMRDLLWSLDGWKSKELRQFIDDFNPEVIWVDGSPLILMNRLNNFILTYSKAPAVTFLMDDTYSYESANGIFDRLYKNILRKHIKKTINRCSQVFVASPLMKEVYDKEFGIESTFIAKSISPPADFKWGSVNPGQPVKMVYFGNVLIGRLDSLIELSNVMNEFNKEGLQFRLDIYTGDYIPDKKRTILERNGVRVHGLVKYQEVAAITQKADVQVFVESLDSSKNKSARLSFSTKIVDYLGSGKCILAIGPKEIAPIKYFKDEGAALVASNAEEIYYCLKSLLEPDTVKNFGVKALECARRNHSRAYMNSLVYGKLNNCIR